MEDKEGRKLSPVDIVRRHVMPEVLHALQDNPEGHVLVFLPGQAEIDAALRTFNANPPKRCGTAIVSTGWR